MSFNDYGDPMDCDDYEIDGVGFAQEGSALRAATRDNPRDQPCPSCGAENRLTRIDVMRHYQCDSCADRAERGYD
jgi:ssDNA-binding Zn-finger/Zn-ribbon topoisomerase 1